MDFEVARATIDYLLRERQTFDARSIIFDFIGGEPLLEIDLIDRISDYAKLRMFETDHPWFDSYRFSFSTNGLLYGKDKVQCYIAKNRSHISICISIDGTKRKHDAQRVFPNGKGSSNAPTFWSIKQQTIRAVLVGFAHREMLKRDRRTDEAL